MLPLGSPCGPIAWPARASPGGRCAGRPQPWAVQVAARHFCGMPPLLLAPLLLLLALRSSLRSWYSNVVLLPVGQQGMSCALKELPQSACACLWPSCCICHCSGVLSCCPTALCTVRHKVYCMSILCSCAFSKRGLFSAQAHPLLKLAPILSAVCAYNVEAGNALEPHLAHRLLLNGWHADASCKSHNQHLEPDVPHTLLFNGRHAAASCKVDS